MAADADTGLQMSVADGVGAYAALPPGDDIYPGKKGGLADIRFVNVRDAYQQSVAVRHTLQ